MSQVQATLDHLFRRESGRMVAYLTRFFGPDHLDLAETVVQEALLRAVQSWPLQGIPENPEGWILRTAKNCAIDHIRKSRDLPQDEEILEALAGATPAAGSQEQVLFDEEIQDDQLKLMFVCCHPDLPTEARVALTLKTVCGFGVLEIARAFLAQEETIAQRLVRAKRKIADLGLRYEVPPPEELPARLDSVIEVLYLLFNEGYLATAGESLIRRDLCEEAIHRTTALARHPVGRHPKIFALLSLMHFQASRFNTRVDAQGDLLLLEEQNRGAWDHDHIRLGMDFLEQAAAGEELSAYHLQAGIASCHAIAPSFDETDWARILMYYDLLMQVEPSPIVTLNRAVALAMAEGLDVGLREVEKLRKVPELRNYYLLPAAIAELLRRQGQNAKAKKFYEEALTLVGTEPERRLILKRLKG